MLSEQGLLVDMPQTARSACLTVLSDAPGRTRSLLMLTGAAPYLSVWLQLRQQFFRGRQLSA